MRLLRYLLIPMLVMVWVPRSSAGPAVQTDSTQGLAQRKRAVELFEKGQEAHQQGNLPSALQLYTSAIGADDSIFQIFYQRAAVYVAMDRYRDAEEDLRKVIDLEPGFAPGHKLYGQVLLDNGKTEDAKRELEMALKLDPSIKGARIAYGSALIKTGKYPEAIEQLKAAIQQEEATALAWALLGVAEEKAGKAPEAIADYSRAIELNPKSAIAHEGRGRLLEIRGEVTGAIQDYTVSYQAQPSRELAIKLADLHTKAGQPQAAVGIYRELLREKPEDHEVRAAMIRLMLDSGQSAEASQEIDSMLKLQPRDRALLMMAGDLYFKERPAQAATYYRRALEVDSNDNLARVQLGASLVRSRQFTDSIELLQEALRREPDNYQAHASLATSLFELKYYTAAAGEFIWIVKARPEVAASYFFLGISFDRIGDCPQAVRAYQEFIRRANPVTNKKEIDDASIRLSLLDKLVKEGKCKAPVKGKG